MTASHAARKPQILVIEDNPGDVELLRMALDSVDLDCDVILIDDGEKAMALIGTQQDPVSPEVPDLMVLDLNLPRSSGLDVLEAMRANEAFAFVPVAVLSSSPSARDRAKIESYNIGIYITKPSELEEFLKIGSILKGLLDNRKAHASSQG